MAVWGKLRPIVDWFDGPRALLIDVVLAGGAAYLGGAEGAADPRPAAVVAATCAGLFLVLLVRRKFPFAVLLVCDGILLLHTNLTPCVLAVYTLAARKGHTSWRTWIGTVLTGAAYLIPADVHWADDLVRAAFPLRQGERV